MHPNLRSEKRHNDKVTSIIRRMVPGDYEHFTEAHCPEMHALGINLFNAVSPPPEKVVAHMLGDTLSTRPSWVKEAWRANGEWVLVQDPGFGSQSADALWLVQAVDKPSDLWTRFEHHGIATDALFLTRQVKGKWLVAIQSSVLKDIQRKSHNTF